MKLESKNYVEVLTVLDKLDSNEFNMIPEDIIDSMRESADGSTYVLEIDSNVKLEEQISRESLSILTYIILRYVADEGQKFETRSAIIKNQTEYEMKLREEFETKDMFYKKDVEKETKPNTNFESLAIIEEPSLWQKIIMKIKKWFSRK